MHYAIIACGEGSRLAGEGVALPKPLVEIEGQPMVTRLARMMADNGAESLTIAVNAAMAGVAEAIEAAGLPMPVKVIAASTPSSLHTFALVAAEVARSHPGAGKMVATTVDTIMRPADFAGYVSRWAAAGPETDGVMAVTPWVDDEKPLWVDADPATGRITAFADQGPAPYVSGGVYGLRPAQAAELAGRCIARGEARMRNYQRALLAEGLTLLAHPIDRIMDIDHAADIDKARAFLAATTNSNPNQTPTTPCHQSK